MACFSVLPFLLFVLKGGKKTPLKGTYGHVHRSAFAGITTTNLSTVTQEMQKITEWFHEKKNHKPTEPVILKSNLVLWQ